MDFWGEELDLDDFAFEQACIDDSGGDSDLDLYESDDDDDELTARLIAMDPSYAAEVASRRERRRLRDNNSSHSDWFPNFPNTDEAVDDDFPYLAAKTSADFEKEIGDLFEDEDDDYQVDHLFFPTYGPVDDLLSDSDDELIDSDDETSFCEFDDETLDFHLSYFESKYSSFLETPAIVYRTSSGPFLCEIRSRRLYAPLNYLTARISPGQRSSWKLRSHSHNIYYDDFPAYSLKRSSFSYWKRLSLQVPTVLDFIGRFHHLVAFFPHNRRQVSHKARDNIINYYFFLFLQYLMSSFQLAYAIFPIFTVLSAFSSSSYFLVGPVSCRAAPTFSSIAKTLEELNSPPWVLGLR